MRLLRFHHAPGCGPARPCEGTLAELLLAIPYFINSRLIPPLPVINQMLQRGQYDAGMSGALHWPALQLDADEYAELVQALRHLGFVDEACPPWVQEHGTWSVWQNYRSQRIPWLKNLAYKRRQARLEKMLESARHQQDEAALAQANARLMRLCMRHMDFIDRHRQPDPRYLRPALPLEPSSCD